MANNIYIGARYVPIFAGEWNSETAYEPLTIVNYYNASYTSKRDVPAGVVPTNTSYWAMTGNYNQQVEEYRQMVVELQKKAEMKQLENCRIVCVGDSYAAGYTPETGDVPANGWPAVMKDILGISSDNFFSTYAGGAGFSAERPGGGYANMLNNFADSVTDKDTIDYVICCGGHNDRESTAIAQGMINFYRTAHTLFPNAVIMFGMVAWDRALGMQNQINNVLQTYLSAALESTPKMLYLSGVENILLRVNSYLASDGKHATAAGNRALAGGIIRAIKTGYCEVYGGSIITATDLTGVTTNSGTPGGYSCLYKGDFVTLTSLKHEFNLDSWSQISGNGGLVELQTLAGLPRFGTASSVTNIMFMPVLMQVADDANGTNARFKYINCAVGILSGKLRIRIYDLNTAGSNWTNNYYRQIVLPEFLMELPIRG